MLSTVIWPEIVLALALNDRQSARVHLQRFEELANQDGVNWSVAHSFLANMGGFIVRFPGNIEEAPSSRSTNATDKAAPQENMIEVSRRPLTSAQGDDETRLRVDHNIHQTTARVVFDPAKFDSLRERSRHPKGDFQAHEDMENVDMAEVGQSPWALDSINAKLVTTALNDPQPSYEPNEQEECLFDWSPESWFGNLVLLRGNIWVLDTDQLLYAREKGIIGKLPDTPEDELDDRNKGDFLIKALAITQVIWIFTQVIIRTAKGYSSSQLEIVVLALSVFTLVIYIVLWRKPQDVRTPIYINAYRRPNTEDLYQLASKGPCLPFPGPREYWTPNAAIHFQGNIYILWGCLLGSITLGCLHCFAWNSHFPSPVELLLWRIAAIVTGGVPPLILLIPKFILVPSGRKRSVQRIIKALDSIIWFGGIPVYILARLYVIVEVFRSLYFADPKDFETTWATNMPSIS